MRDSYCHSQEQCIQPSYKFANISENLNNVMLNNYFNAYGQTSLSYNLKLNWFINHLRFNLLLLLHSKKNWVFWKNIYLPIFINTILAQCPTMIDEICQFAHCNSSDLLWKVSNLKLAFDSANWWYLKRGREMLRSPLFQCHAYGYNF